MTVFRNHVFSYHNGGWPIWIQRGSVTPFIFLRSHFQIMKHVIGSKFFKKKEMWDTIIMPNSQTSMKATFTKIRCQCNLFCPEDYPGSIAIFVSNNNSDSVSRNVRILEIHLFLGQLSSFANMSFCSFCCSFFHGNILFWLCHELRPGFPIYWCERVQCWPLEHTTY